ncbi:hypothetical protein RRG08_048061 [Elysia crispata]|uniref:Uncharacterized protein n=1 Tax=Elysia crispata TaxID=231223 RepID=A0AAE0Z4G9_9GAST|nr:hypothetical protein RRG08_048061 [Elysia crispata]
MALETCFLRIGGLLQVKTENCHISSETAGASHRKRKCCKARRVEPVAIDREIGRLPGGGDEEADSETLVAVQTGNEARAIAGYKTGYVTQRSASCSSHVVLSVIWTTHTQGKHDVSHIQGIQWELSDPHPSRIRGLNEACPLVKSGQASRCINHVQSSRQLL